jgi:hypothetical protein
MVGRSKRQLDHMGNSPILKKPEGVIGKTVVVEFTLAAEKISLKAVSLKGLEMIQIWAGIVSVHNIGDSLAT